MSTVYTYGCVNTIGFAVIGSEYGIVLLSIVRSKPVHELRLGGEGGEEKKNADIGWIMKNLGFVRDSHQICVGITRCKYGLVIVGKLSIFCSTKYAELPVIILL